MFRRSSFRFVLATTSRLRLSEPLRTDDSGKIPDEFGCLALCNCSFSPSMDRVVCGGLLDKDALKPSHVFIFRVPRQQQEQDHNAHEQQEGKSHEKQDSTNATKAKSKLLPAFVAGSFSKDEKEQQTDIPVLQPGESTRSVVCIDDATVLAGTMSGKLVVFELDAREDGAGFTTAQRLVYQHATDGAEITSIDVCRKRDIVIFVNKFGEVNCCSLSKLLDGSALQDPSLVSTKKLSERELWSVRLHPSSSSSSFCAAGELGDVFVGDVKFNDENKATMIQKLTVSAPQASTAVDWVKSHNTTQRCFVSGGDDRRLRIFETSPTLREVHMHCFQESSPKYGYVTYLRTVQLSEQHEIVAVVSFDGMLRVFELESAKLVPIGEPVNLKLGSIEGLDVRVHDNRAHIAACGSGRVSLVTVGY